MAEETNETPRGVNLLLDFLLNPVNIAEQLDDDTLARIGQKAIEGFDADKDSMVDWERVVEKGFELIKPETHSKSDPWPGAANFKSPVIIDASLKFGDRASAELLRGPNIVKTRVIGQDKNSQKEERGERVARYMNWQINQEMPTWIKEHNKLLYDMPYTGCIFKKIFFSREQQGNVSELITYPDFVVNHNATSLEKARRFTQLMEFSRNEVIERQRGGLWLDIDIPDSNTDDDKTDEQAPDDKINTYFEQQTFIDLDEDGYEEPYTITVHQGSKTVLRIVPRFTADGVLLKDEENQRSARLSDLIQQDGTLAETDGEREVIKIEPLNNIVKYGFLHNPDGGLLDVGYFHLLAGVNGAINVTTNSLINAGNTANTQGGWLAKGFREKLGNMRTKPGLYQQTTLSAQDLANGIRDYNFKEPSPTLFQLNQMMVQTAQQTSASVDLTGVLGANAPATTTLALVQEQQQATGAIILRIYRSMSDEFKLLYQLNSEFLDEAQYQEVVDDEQASAADFNLTDLDIVPVANPEVSSKIQRIQLAQVEMSQLESVALAGGQIQPIVKGFFEAIGSQQTDEIFPEISEEEQQQQQAQQQQQIQEQQALQEITIDHAERDQDNQDIKAKASALKDQASAVKSLEEAETEQTKNLSDKYTGAINIDQQVLALQKQQQDVNQQAAPITNP